jgi:hypothetical protein
MGAKVAAAVKGSSSNSINHWNMRAFIIILVLLSLVNALKAQEKGTPDEGTITYITSQNVYVQFKSTENISPGDTLFFPKDNLQVPALIVTNKSSMSCVCTPVSGISLKQSDKVYTSGRTKAVPVQEIAKDTVAKPVVVAVDTTYPAKETKKKSQHISGRASISSNLNFSNTPGGNSQRFRYTFSMNALNIANTKLSGECYISFVQRSGYSSEVKNDIWNGLKIYDLALKYDFNETTRLWLGRKINPNLSIAGAIDGLQFEKNVKSFLFGAYVGSRPDYQDYSFNFDLFQYGAYAGHEYANKNGSAQSTLAFVNQENTWNTDRRFLYFQHSNALLKNLYFFGTIDFELYQNINGQQSGVFNLTDYYILLRYKVIKQLSLSVSWSSRTNLIFYETYKNNVDNLVNNAPVNGLAFQAQYHPLAKLTIGARVSYRDRKTDPRPSWNADGYATYSMVPALKVSATASATFMQSAWVDGKIFSLMLNRDLVSGRLYCGAGYKFVMYSFYSNETAVNQNVASVNLNWNIWKKLFMSVNYEGTFENDTRHYNRVYINLTQRF